MDNMRDIKLYASGGPENGPVGQSQADFSVHQLADIINGQDWLPIHIKTAILALLDTLPNAVNTHVI